MERQPVDNVSLIYSVAMLVFEKVGFLPPPPKKKKNMMTPEILWVKHDFFSFTIDARKNAFFRCCAQELNISYLPLRLKLPVQVLGLDGKQMGKLNFCHKDTEGLIHPHGHRCWTDGDSGDVSI